MKYDQEVAYYQKDHQQASDIINKLDRDKGQTILVLRK